MPEVPLIAIEIVLGFGVPIGWGVWQLISLRREKERDKALLEEAERAARPEAAEAPPKV